MGRLSFYEPQEKLAVEQIAARVGSLPDCEYDGRSPNQILNPAAYFQLNHEAVMPSFGIRPGQSLVTRLSESEQFLRWKFWLRDYPPFINIREYGRTEITLITDRMRITHEAASGNGLIATYGYAWHNRWDPEKSVRKTSKIGVVKVTCRESGIYAEVMDNQETNCAEDDDMLGKFLFISNPGGPRFFSLRRFVKRLRDVFIDDCHYDLIYGHPAVMEEPRHIQQLPPAVDPSKRFRRCDSKTVRYSDGEEIVFKISRLTRLWEITGMTILASPETDQLAVGFIGESYKKKLLARDKKFWEQFL